MGKYPPPLFKVLLLHSGLLKWVYPMSQGLPLAHRCLYFYKRDPDKVEYQFYYNSITITFGLMFTCMGFATSKLPWRVFNLLLSFWIKHPKSIICPLPLVGPPGSPQTFIVPTVTTVIICHSDLISQSLQPAYYNWHLITWYHLYLQSNIRHKCTFPPKRNLWTWRTDMWLPRGKGREWDGLGVWG